VRFVIGLLFGAGIGYALASMFAGSRRNTPEDFS
jgi:hypothetical protein